MSYKLKPHLLNLMGLEINQLFAKSVYPRKTVKKSSMNTLTLTVQYRHWKASIIEGVLLMFYIW